MIGTQEKHGLIWGGLLVLVGLLALINNIIGATAWLWIGALALIGTGSLIIYLMDPSERWPLIPAYAGLALAAFLLLIQLDILAPVLIAPLIISLVGLPFVAVFLLDRSRWWALIPGYVLFSVALLVLVQGLNWMSGAWLPSFILGTIALPFIVVFLINRENWWALIPAYVLVSLALMLSLISSGILADSLVAVYVLLSIALPFFVVYVIDRRQWWALIPGGINALIGLSILVAAESLFQYLIPIILMLAGVLLLVRVFRPGSDRSNPEPAASGSQEAN
jgi:hypothetical protein